MCRPWPSTLLPFCAEVSEFFEDCRCFLVSWAECWSTTAKFLWNKPWYVRSVQSVIVNPIRYRGWLSSQKSSTVAWALRFNPYLLVSALPILPQTYSGRDGLISSFAVRCVLRKGWRMYHVGVATQASWQSWQHSELQCAGPAHLLVCQERVAKGLVGRPSFRKG